MAVATIRLPERTTVLRGTRDEVIPGINDKLQLVIHCQKATAEKDLGKADREATR